MTIALGQLSSSTVLSRSSKVITDDSGGTVATVAAILGLTIATDITGLAAGATSNFGTITGSIGDGGILASTSALAAAALPQSQLAAAMQAVSTSVFVTILESLTASQQIAVLKQWISQLPNEVGQSVGTLVQDEAGYIRIIKS